MTVEARFNPLTRPLDIKAVLPFLEPDLAQVIQQNLLTAARTLQGDQFPIVSVGGKVTGIGVTLEEAPHEGFRNQPSLCFIVGDGVVVYQMKLQTGSGDAVVVLDNPTVRAVTNRTDGQNHLIIEGSYNTSPHRLDVRRDGQHTLEPLV